MTLTAIYSTLVLSLIACLIALAIATAYVRAKPADPIPIGSGGSSRSSPMARGPLPVDLSHGL